MFSGHIDFLSRQWQRCSQQREWSHNEHCIEWFHWEFQNRHLVILLHDLEADTTLQESHCMFFYNWLLVLSCSWLGQMLRFSVHWLKATQIDLVVRLFPELPFPRSRIIFSFQAKREVKKGPEVLSKVAIYSDHWVNSVEESSRKATTGVVLIFFLINE